MEKKEIWRNTNSSEHQILIGDGRQTSPIFTHIDTWIRQFKMAMAMSEFWHQQHHHFTVSCHATSKTQCGLGHGVFLRKRRNRFPRWWQKALVLVSFWNGILSKLNDWGWASSGWWFQPLWKIWKSVGMMTFPIYGKHVRNHQPVLNRWFVWANVLTSNTWSQASSSEPQKQQTPMSEKTAVHIAKRNNILELFTRKVVTISAFPRCCFWYKKICSTWIWDTSYIRLYM